MRPRRQQPRPSLLHERSLPAPVGGMNLVDPPAELSLADAIFILNYITSEHGLKPRPGWKEHCTGVGTGEVRSVLDYAGTIGLRDRLFACTQAGIYDVTTSSAAPPQVLLFGIADANSGYGVSVAYVTAADHFLLYTDETNGYLLYTESTGLWTAGAVTGVTPSALSFVTQWKSRIWFAERGTSRAWYLAAGAVAGAATAFDFGPLFKHGGTLVGLWSWTIDGGQGMDDRLVAISSSGDVVVFQGTDPASASTFEQKGSWFVGGVPAGRNIATSFGGDILILTQLGILPISKLSTGEAASPDTYETRKVRPLFVSTMNTQAGRRGWGMQLHPTESFLLVNTPGLPGTAQEQFAMGLATRGWSRLRGLDILSMAVWNKEFYYGTRDGRVCKNTGFVDNVARTGSTANARTVDAAVLSAFSTFGQGAKKIARIVRPNFLTHGVNPSFECRARYDYDISEVVAGSSALSPPTAGTWDNALWDSALWGSDFGRTLGLSGGSGLGTAIAVSLRTSTQDYAVYVGSYLAWEPGGML